jgi:hypothetical protein
MGEEERPINRELLEDIEYQYTEKRRILDPKFNLNKTPAVEQHLTKAVYFCEDLNVHPAELVNTAYEMMGNKKEYFGLKNLYGTALKHKLNESRAVRPTDTIIAEVTLATIDIGLLWDAQVDMLYRYLGLGYSEETILMNSSLKFYAWFRLIVSEKVYPEVSAKYHDVAVKELRNNPSLRKFLKDNNLPIERISS